MIRISTSQPGGLALFKVEGRAAGPSGVELTRVLEQALLGHKQISLDLESLQTIDQPTLEFLVRGRERFVIASAPRYLNRWLEGLRKSEGFQDNSGIASGDPGEGVKER